MRRRPSAIVACLFAACFAAGEAHARTGDRPLEWLVLLERSRDALAGLAHANESEGAAPAHTLPHTFLIGFTGGVEKPDSRVSGVVRLRRVVSDQFGDSHGVTATAYSNFRWRSAAAEVSDRVRAVRAAHGAGAEAQPTIVVYGHSWGAGAIGKFARALRSEGLEVSLAIYIDAFTLRNPRVPDNVHYAVNLYQRTGILRGLPLRGKKRLKADAAESTVILGSLRITPDTGHFGWNWNLVQPLLYRHHHRMSHDRQLQDYVLDVVAATAPALKADTR